MNRPIVIRQILSHVSRRCVVPFRLRTTDADRLVKYVEHLEANQRSETAVTVRLHSDMSVSLDPEERVLAHYVEQAAHQLDAPCVDCGTVGGHLAACASLPATHADDCSLHPGHSGACAAFYVGD